MSHLRERSESTPAYADEWCCVSSNKHQSQNHTLVIQSYAEMYRPV